MDYKIVHRTFICAVLLALALMFVGCGNDSFIMLSSTESPARATTSNFELDISGISGAELTAELRQNGNTTTEPLISLDNSAKELSLALIPGKNKDGKYNQINVTASSGDLTGNAMFHDLPEAIGWSFTTRKLNEKIQITAGESKILAVLALDTGNGAWTIDLDAIDQKDYDCIVIIRAEFK
mgnify:CR=1 FL=1